MGITFSVRLDNETKDRLERLAKSTARPKTYLVTNAIKEYLDLNEWQIREIEKAIQEADKPGAKFIEHEKVKAKWEGRLAHPVGRKSKQKS